MGTVSTSRPRVKPARTVQLLDLLDLRGCVVTIDAAGCQKDIAAQIVAKGADYVLALKENQPALYEQVADYFLGQIAAGSGGKLRRHLRAEEGHGRTEARETFVAPAPEEMVAAGAWAGLATIAVVIRRCVDHATGKASDEARRMAGLTQKQLAERVGTHQSVISRIEDADYDGHSLGMLKRVARA